MLQIAIFASGSGTNADNLIKYFSSNKEVRIDIVLANNAEAGVISKAEKSGIAVKIFSRKQFLEGNEILNCLKDRKIDFIILAGFLLLVPDNIIQRYENMIINIHPTLLPAHGGKGFYGSKVHQAVIDAGSIMSGITIHKVNTKFDDGEIIFQAACHISKEDTAETLASKIHSLEYKYFPVVIEKYMGSLIPKSV